MRYWSTIFLLIFFILAIVVVRSLPAFASIDDEIASIGKQLEDLKKSLSQKEANRQALKQRLENIVARIGYLQDEIQKKENEVKKGEAALAYQQKLLDERARSFYKNAKKASFSLINIFVSDNLSASVDNFFYQKTVVDQDKNMIIKIVLYIKNLEETKRNLENEKNQLAALQQEVDRQTKILEGEIAQTRQAIAQLTAKQQELIAKKFASIYIPRSASVAYSCKPDFNPRDGSLRSAGFSPQFGFFTFGVPNRVGLNQWGAYGRAKAGQNEEEILRAYYNFDEIATVDTNIKIRVDGLGEYSLEDYMKRIYEVPDSWGADGFAALKAQAIAARSYVLAYTQNGQNSICATESCQVVKADPKGGFWEKAVNETSGKVMKQGGVIIKAWYSSTHGGYILSSADVGWSSTGWTKRARDTNGEIGSFSDLFARAYDRDSPIFYCNWGSRPSYNNTAWLRAEEVADIVNVILLARADASTKAYLYQVDAGGNVWDENKVKDELRKRGITPFNRIDSGSVTADFGSGRVSSVSFSGDAGSISFDGSEFKDWFNARAPANIQIRGPLYEIVKK